MTQRPETRCPACFQDKGNATACDHCGWKPGSPPANPLYLPLGTPLGDSYVIGKVLGHGGLGITYLAWDRELDTRIAIKEFLPDTMAGRNTRDAQVTIHTGHEEPFRHALQRFREEARILARFQQHPGIVSVYRFLAANGTGYMAMEFVAGVTLRQYLETHDNRIPWPEALGLLGPVMDTLDRIHDQGLLHRDIAPDNIYITHDGKLKLLDFGAAREVTEERSVTLSVVLKEGYAPEEQYHKKAREGPWTDVYALSATLYRAVTGQLPPTALDRLHDDELRSPSALGVAIPEDHEAVLLKGLAIRARDRWQGVGEMRRAWQAESETVVEPPEPETPEVQPPRPDTYAKYGLWIALFTAVITALMMILELKLTDKIDLWSNGSDHELTVHDPVVLLAENSATRGSGTPTPESSTSGTAQRGDSSAAAPESDISGSVASAGNASDNPPPRAPSLGRLNQTENLSSSAVPSSESQRQAPDAILEDLEADGASRGDNIPRAVPDPALAGPLPATLLVTVSDPPDATVTLNGEAIDPGVGHELVAGEYSLRVTGPGHAPFQEDIRLAAGDDQRRSVRLEPLPARVIVRSNVTGDTVFIDGEAVGATGPEPHVLAPGEYAIRVEKAGFKPFDTETQLTAGAEETIQPKLEPAKAELIVMANISGAKVFLDGQPLGAAGAPHAVRAGTHTMRVEKKGYEPFEAEVELVVREQKTVMVWLTQKAMGHHAEVQKPDKDMKYALWIAAFTAVITAFMLILQVMDKINLVTDRIRQVVLLWKRLSKLRDLKNLFRGSSQRKNTKIEELKTKIDQLEEKVRVLREENNATHPPHTVTNIYIDGFHRR
uniref:Serine/threonine protein kinase n=1 Tax=Candidatus Kentrum sp. LFY TaxID=2126342 RepID=A0A450UNV0_9GAMM|nr:MAG: Serine/threonine protein kinase [Candidatus Kentron sp. LFY]